MAPDPSRPTTATPAFSRTQASARAADPASPPGLTHADLGAVELNRDMSQYIRTYAKDVARATNQPAPAPSTKANDTPAPSVRSAAKTDTKENPVLKAVLKEKSFSGVVLPEMDSSPVNRPGGTAKEFPTETVDLKKEDSAGIFTQSRKQPSTPFVPAAPPLPPPPPPPPAPKPVQPQVVSAPTPAPLSSSLPKKNAPSPDTADQSQKATVSPSFTNTPAPAAATNVESDREAVLARLRKKLADSQAASSVPPAAATVASVNVSVPAPKAPSPLPPPPPPAPIPAPVPLERPAPIIESTWQPPPPPRPLAQPTPAPLTATQPAGPQGSDPLHTYSSDFAGRIDQERASAFSVLAAQQDAGQGRTAPEAPGRRPMLPIILAVLLILLGAAGLFAAYRFMYPASSTQQTLGVPSLIFADEKMEIKGPNYRQSLADATTEPLVDGNILVTYVTTASSTALGLNVPQPGGILIRELNLGAPDILLRNVDLLSTVGIIRAGSETRPFFILRVNSYERTFAGMLGWEQRMLASFDPLYPLYSEPVPFMADPVATTTPVVSGATSTSTLGTPPAANAPELTFVDVVVSNYDARALKDASGRTLIIYGYRDSQTLIIARDEAAFTALIARLAASNSL